jgi:hypothetical protein
MEDAGVLLRGDGRTDDLAFDREVQQLSAREREDLGQISRRAN